MLNDVILMIAENYGATVSERTLYMWQAMLEDYPVEMVSKAAMNLIRNVGPEKVAYKTMPPFALMQKELDAVSGGISDRAYLLEMKAEAAWDTLLETIERVGSYRVPSNLDETTLYCIRSLGGWRRVCSWLESELQWRKEEFTDLFKSVNGKTAELMAGIDAVEALGMRGKSEPKPIGDVIGSFLASKKPKELES